MGERPDSERCTLLDLGLGDGVPPFGPFEKDGRLWFESIGGLSCKLILPVLSLLPLARLEPLLPPHGPACCGGGV